MNLNDPVENLWLGKIQMELGVHVTNGLLTEARLEAAQHALTKAIAENEALKAQVEAMGQSNAAFRTEVARLTELLKSNFKQQGETTDG